MNRIDFICVKLAEVVACISGHSSVYLLCSCHLLLHIYFVLKLCKFVQINTIQYNLASLSFTRPSGAASMTVCSSWQLKWLLSWNVALLRCIQVIPWPTCCRAKLPSKWVPDSSLIFSMPCYRYVARFQYRLKWFLVARRSCLSVGKHGLCVAFLQ